MIPIGKKKIPAKRERFFGFVLKTADSLESLTEDMGYEQHETKTAGTRSTEAARIAGEGMPSHLTFNVLLQQGCLPLLVIQYKEEFHVHGFCCRAELTNLPSKCIAKWLPQERKDTEGSWVYGTSGTKRSAFNFFFQ